jgi:hypothetical protein
MGINFTENTFWKWKLLGWKGWIGEMLHFSVENYKTIVELFNWSYLFYSSFCCVFSLLTVLHFHVSCFSNALEANSKTFLKSKQKTWSDNSYFEEREWRDVGFARGVWEMIGFEVVWVVEFEVWKVEVWGVDWERSSTETGNWATVGILK